MDVCSGGMKATICEPKLRTYNINATCGGDEDYYYYSPWRAPGSAPVLDSCGMAGGTPHAGGFGAQIKNTSVAKQGDLGSKLPQQPSGVIWAAGEVAEVSWSIMANHGGGYQYRLCPASEPLTEECFFKTPLKFVGKPNGEPQQKFRWGGRGGHEENITGTYVSEGTLPKGSMWAMNPIPDFGSDKGALSFEPRCKEIPGCGSAMETKCRCSGEWGPYDLEIVDWVQIPADLPAGEYVLGWRWDCEESNQIWSSCSDVTIVHPKPTVLV